MIDVDNGGGGGGYPIGLGILNKNKTMKYEIHVPVEQFGYIEATYEGDDEGAAAAFYSLRNALQGGAGIKDKDFNLFLDEYLSKGNSEGLAGVWEEMNLEQQSVFRAIKRSKGRTTK